MTNQPGTSPSAPLVPMWRRRLIDTMVAAGLVASTLVGVAGADTGGTVAGHAFLDTNRDGSRQDSEPPLAGKRIYLFDRSGAYLANQLMDASGSYAFAGMPDGNYRVEYGKSDWWEIWENWVPTTTGSVRPVVELSLSDAATVDFGWRAIVRSTDPARPLSSFTAPTGLRVESFNDAVSATDVYSTLMDGTLQGGEASKTSIRFDINPRDYCVSQTTEIGGVYTDFSAGCSIAYLRWLDSGDQIMFHEYGHAWADYHAYIVQQDPSLRSYLQARGIDPADPRLGTTHAWSRFEMIAEDYRQLFGSLNARSRYQENREIPPAREVPGLESFLSTTFMTSTPGVPPEPEDVPAPVAIEDLRMNPNPIKRDGTVEFLVVEPAEATVTIVDAKGGVVRKLTESAAMRGAQAVRWDRKDSLGRRVKPGPYRVIVQVTDGRSSAEAEAGFKVS